MADDATPATFEHPAGHDIPTVPEMADVFATFPDHDNTVPQYQCEGCHLRLGEQWRYELAEFPDRTPVEHGRYHDRWLRKFHQEHGLGDTATCPTCP